MTSVSRINQLYGSEDLDKAQRHQARFLNSCLMMTLDGAAVSDGLDNHQVISGVGGQYNFVAMAHALSEGRSILKLRATRTSKGGTTSNIVWNYGHTTIPRHLRDIVITEYGIADLRGKTDAEVMMAMLNICDSRFQSDLLVQAKKARKLPESYDIPLAFRSNTPPALRSILKPFRQSNILPEYPLGTDLSEVEQDLVRAATHIQSIRHSKIKLAKVFLSGLALGSSDRFSAHMKRMGYESGVTKTILLAALEKTKRPQL